LRVTKAETERDSQYSAKDTHFSALSPGRRMGGFPIELPFREQDDCVLFIPSPFSRPSWLAVLQTAFFKTFPSVFFLLSLDVPLKLFGHLFLAGVTWVSLF